MGDFCYSLGDVRVRCHLDTLFLASTTEARRGTLSCRGSRAHSSVTENGPIDTYHASSETGFVTPTS